MTNLRDNLMKPEDIHDCFNTQTDVIARLENTNRKLAELNQLSEQKFKRVQKSFVNAASMLQKMQGDLGFIHGAIKKLTHLSTLEKSAVDKTTAIVQSQTGEIDVPVSNNTEAQQPVEIKNEAPEQKNENVIEENKAPEQVTEPEVRVEEKAEEVAVPEVKAEEQKTEEVVEPEAKVEEVVEPEVKAEEQKTEEINEPEKKAEEEKTEDAAPPAPTEEENTEEAPEEKQEGHQPEKKKKNKKKKH